MKSLYKITNQPVPQLYMKGAVNIYMGLSSKLDKFDFTDFIPVKINHCNAGHISQFRN